MQPNTSRLLQLVDFLDEVPATAFDFGIVYRQTECGSAGCAMGQTPKIWPDLVRFTGNDKYKTIVTESSEGYLAVAMELFDISCEDAGMLFEPGPTSCGHLPATASSKKVADHIRKFVKWLA